ncbi:MAG: transcription termination factor NusA [Anaerolineae bacterium]
MKSEFLLAFNEICQERGLPQDTVIEALKTALVSAYRRNAAVSSMQGVTVEIDSVTGDPTIYAEKEVVDSIFEPKTEILLEDAHAQGLTDAKYGDLVMAISTPRNFGRIAAQTAKQVILQRVREAERDQLFDDFAERDGEIVNGTVQSTSGTSITIGLGRTEATLPASQQVKSERYRAHDKIRVYVLEVRRTNRGPSIIVSRSHRNLLRRLLELEVPEIYNGQVDIKSIAREAGQRSKVAVVALQPGVDPVGACVGMRGVRIQSIVRELSDEKIDVIEWDPNQQNFIAKALSPARVSGVYLEEHPDQGKTAVVIVPDDQLSLAIGREGQNARLAAKLTGWRIDIKSLTESASDSLKSLDHPDADPAIVADTELHTLANVVIEKRRGNRPITNEDYKTLEKLVTGVEGRIIAIRAAKHDEIRKDRAEVRKRIPAIAFEHDLEELDLIHRYHAILLEAGKSTVGDALFQMHMGEETLLAMDGFGDKALEDFRKKTKEYMDRDDVKLSIAEARAAAEEAKAAAPVAAEPVAVVEEAPAVVAEPEAVEAVAEIASDELETADEVPVDEEVAAEIAEAFLAEPATETEETAEDAVEEEEEAVTEAPEAEVVEAKIEEEEVIEVEEEVAAPVEPTATAEPEKTVVAEDGEKPLVGLEPIIPLEPIVPFKAKEEKKVKPRKKKVVVARKTRGELRAEEAAKEEAKKNTKKSRELIFDEDAGRVVARRKRKGQRQDDWVDPDDV